MEFDIEVTLRLPTNKEVELALFEDEDDFPSDRRSLILELAPESQIRRVIRMREQVDGFKSELAWYDLEPSEFLDERLKDD